jgi:feruloyl-CoA synthase
MPGAVVKFVPNAGKLELRVKGDHIFPGYRGNDAATRDAFDDEGFYKIGDAGRLLDAADAASGIVFDGRVAEDFKLASGTWVSVGTLRVRVVSALAPWAADAVITGHDRNEIGALVFPSEAARALMAESPQALAEHVRNGLRALKAEGGGSSQTPTRAIILAEPPSLSAGEITDKGYLNQRLCLQRRASDVQALHATPADPRAILLA